MKLSIYDFVNVYRDLLPPMEPQLLTTTATFNPSQQSQIAEIWRAIQQTI